ncbi:hypothetical protein Tco_0314109 [Tanacetum coccineum]
MATNEETYAAGTDTRPPMFSLKDDYAFNGNIRIQSTFRGKPNGKLYMEIHYKWTTPHRWSQILHLLARSSPTHLNILNVTSTAQEN